MSPTVALTPLTPGRFVLRCRRNWHSSWITQHQHSSCTCHDGHL